MSCSESRYKQSNILKLLSTQHGLQWRRVHQCQTRLEHTRKTSIILAAFTFCVFSSLQQNFPSGCPEWIFTLLAVNSALLVGMNSLTFIISTFILPKLQAVAEEYHSPTSEDEEMYPVPEISPHDKFLGFVALSYNIAHILGLFLFLINIAIVAWVKFWDVSINACIAGSVIVIPFVIAFLIFCWYFYRCLNIHLYHTRENLLRDVEDEYHQSEETLAEKSSTPREDFRAQQSTSKDCLNSTFDSHVTLVQRRN